MCARYVQAVRRAQLVGRTLVRVSLEGERGVCPAIRLIVSVLDKVCEFATYFVYLAFEVVDVFAVAVVLVTGVVSRQVGHSGRRHRLVGVVGFSVDVR